MNHHRTAEGSWRRIAAIVSGLALAALCGCPATGPGKTEQVRQAMGSLFTIEAYGPDQETVDRAVEAAFAEVEELDRLLTIYDPGSQLMKVNRGAGRSAVAVDPRVMDVLKQARRWWKISEGAFDPSVGPLLKLWGIPDGGGPGTYPPPIDYIQPALNQVGMDKVILDDITNTVRLEREDMSLDLGGIVRGFAIDAAVRVLREGGVTSARVEVGNDARVFGGVPGGGPWTIAVPHPRDPEILLAELALEEGAVSTTLDTTKQVFVAANQKYYTHIVDPESGVPVEWVASFTVVAPEAATADALATACFVRGKGEGLHLVKQLDEVEAMVVWFEKDNVTVLKPSGTFGIRELLKSGPNVETRKAD